MTPSVISTAEIAAILHISEQRVRTLLRSGLIHGKQMGKHWVADPQAVTAYVAAGSSDNPSDRARRPSPLPAVKALSFFSGAMGLDLGSKRRVFMRCWRVR